MPALKDLVCVVQWAATASPFPEYATQYGDGVVETYVAIPTHPQAFTVRLTSRKFIADGLSMIVFIDGNYQCNRNRVNLQPPKSGQARQRSEIDFTVRQKEKPMGDGTYMGREWRFDNHNIVPNIPDGVKEAHFDDLGTIEVLVLRCCTANPIERDASPVSSAEHSAVLDMSAEFRHGWLDVSEKQDRNPEQTAPSSAPPHDQDDFAGGMLGLFDGPADYRPRYYPNPRDETFGENHHWDSRHAYQPSQGSSRPPYTSQHGTSPYFTHHANPHGPRNPNDEAQVPDATRGSRRVHFDFGDHGGQRNPRVVYDDSRSSSKPQWVDDSSYQQFRGRPEYYNPEVRFRGPDPYADYEAYDGIGHVNLDTHRPVYQEFPEQYRPAPHYSSRSPPLRMPSSASLPPNFWPNPFAGHSTVPHAQQIPSSAVPPAPAWVPGPPHIPVWFPPSAMPMPPLNRTVPLYQFPNTASGFFGHNAPNPSNPASSTTTAQTEHAQNTSQNPGNAIIGGGGVVGSTQSEQDGKQPGSHPTTSSPLDSWENTVTVNSPHNNVSASGTPGQQGWAIGGDWTGIENTAASNGDGAATANFDHQKKDNNDDSWADKGATASTGNGVGDNSNDGNEKPTNADDWGNSGFNDSTTNTGEWSNAPPDHSARPNDGSWENDGGDSSNHKDKSPGTNAGWDSSKKQESQPQSDHNWSNDHKTQANMNDQAGGSWGNPQNGQTAGKWNNGARTSDNPNPVANETTPTPLGPGWRDLYGPHGAYLTTKALADADVPPDAEEEPRYDVPAPIAQAKGISKQVQPGKGYLYFKKRCAPHYIDSLEEPYARFVFKYRTKEQIKNEVGIEIEAEPTGDEEVNALESLDKAELIKLVIRAKGALGGQIPTGPIQVPSSTATPSFEPVPVEPPNYGYLKYNLPPGRNVSNPGLGISTASNPPQGRQNNPEVANSWSNHGSNHQSNSQQLSNEEWVAGANTSNQTSAQKTNGGGWDGQQEKPQSGKGPGSVASHPQDSSMAVSKPSSTTFNQENPASTKAPTSSTAWNQEQSSQSQPSGAGLEFLGSGTTGEGFSTQGKPKTPPLGPVSPDLPAVSWPDVPPPPLFPCGNEEVPEPSSGW